MLAMHERDRLAPVALAREHPVAELEIDLFPADALLLKVGDHGRNGLAHLQAVQETGIDHLAVAAVRVGLLFDVAALDDLDDRQAEFLCKIVVALVVRGDRHDRARAVAHEHIVGRPDRDLLAGHRVDRGHAFERHARFFLCKLATLKIALERRRLLVGSHLVEVLDAALQRLDDGVLGRYDHVGRAKQRVAAGRIDEQALVGIRDAEPDLRALAPADPVLLLRLDLIEIVHKIEIVDEPFRILGDLQHPLRTHHAHDLAAAALAAPVHDLLVRKADLAARAEIDRDLRLVGKPLLKEFQEDPLRPLVVLGIGRVHLAGIVEGIAETLQLLAETRHIVMCDLCGVDPRLDGIVLRRQAERVVADGEEHVIALHAALSRNDVHCGERARMADVQSLSGWIGKLDQAVEFRLVMRALRFKAALVRPALLPFQLNVFRVIAFRHTLCILPNSARNRAPGQLIHNIIMYNAAAVLSIKGRLKPAANPCKKIFKKHRRGS